MIKTNEPVAWAVTPRGNNEEIDCEFIYPDPAIAGDVALGALDGESDAVVVPLYREPRPALTGAEREAIKEAADSYDDGCNERCREITKIFRGLLERLGGGVDD